MADERTEKQKVQEITDKLEQGLKELFGFAFLLNKKTNGIAWQSGLNGCRCERDLTDI